MTRITRVLLGLAAVIAVLVPASPVEASHSWSWSGCDNRVMYTSLHEADQWGWWYSGWPEWWWVQTGADGGAGAIIQDAWEAIGWECGAFEFPVSYLSWNGSFAYWQQDFNCGKIIYSPSLVSYWYSSHGCYY